MVYCSVWCTVVCGVLWCVVYYISWIFHDHSFRIALANAVANETQVPLGDVLVYDVVNFNVSNTECLRATLRMTGASRESCDVM